MLDHHQLGPFSPPKSFVMRALANYHVPREDKRRKGRARWVQSDERLPSHQICDAKFGAYSTYASSAVRTITHIRSSELTNKRRQTLMSRMYLASSRGHCRERLPVYVSTNVTLHTSKMDAPLAACPNSRAMSCHHR